MIDLTEPTVSHYIDPVEFETEAMQCETLLLDTCENILTSANQFIDTCMHTLNYRHSVLIEEQRIECVKEFLPRIRKRVNRLGGVFTRCMDRTSVKISEQGVTAIMATINEGIKTALFRYY